MKRALCMLILWALMPIALAQSPEPTPLSAADFAVALPGGAFNMVTDDRADLERVTGQVFAFYDEFPNLGISYDRLLTDTANFFADVGVQRVNQVTFKGGCVTARGIGLYWTQAQVFDAYGQPFSRFEEHGYMRAAYTLDVKDDRYELLILISVPHDRVVDIHMNGSGVGW